MKKLLTILTLTLTVCLAQAASPKKSKDPAFADTWNQNTKTYAGKKITTVILDIAAPGGIPSDATHAALKVTTGNTRGDAGGDIIALMPAKDVPGFIQKANAVGKGAGSKFGAKIVYPVHTAIFTTIEGENVLVFGEVPKLDGKKPSELLALQEAAGAPEPTEATTDKKTDSKKHPEGKTGKKSSK